MITVNCPTCHAPVQWQPENAYRPFCSERCKLIDLGAWADEQHALPALPETPEEWDALHHDRQPHGRWHLPTLPKSSG